MKKRLMVGLMLGLVSMIGVSLAQPVLDVNAANVEVEAGGGTVYTCDGESDYSVGTASESEKITSGSDVLTYGALKLEGAVKEDGTLGEYAAYGVEQAGVSLAYVYDDSLYHAAEEEWHLMDDEDTSVVNGIVLSGPVRKGTILVQVAPKMDSGKQNWYTIYQHSNVFEENHEDDEVFFTVPSRFIGQGHYCRVVVAYELGIKTGEEAKYVIDALGTKAVYDTQKKVEIYNLYFYDASVASKNDQLKIDQIPSEELTVNAGKDNGFSGNTPIDGKDSHYGWKMGDFYISGYAEKNETQGVPVYMREIGKDVSLHYYLAQDIDCLNGDSSLIVYEDTNAYNQSLNNGAENRGRGVLYIEYKAWDGGKTVVPYQDFLTSVASGTSDVEVISLQEGDYRIILNYELRKQNAVAGVNTTGSYSDYSMEYSFKVRNSAAAFFPFDVETHSILNSGSFTKDGFEIDLAESHYLTIRIKRSVLNLNNGRYSMETAEEYSATEHSVFTEPGIYTITVSSEYSGSSDPKTIYVGNTKELLALSGCGGSVDEMNRKLSEGYVIADDGSFILETEAPTEESPAESDAESGSAVASQTVENIQQETSSGNVTRSGGSGFNPIILVGIAAVVVIAGVVVVVARKKKKTD